MVTATNSIYKIFKKSIFFWISSISIQIVTTPILLVLFFLGLSNQKYYWATLIIFFCSMIICGVLNFLQHINNKKSLHALEQDNPEENLEKLKSYLDKTTLIFIPLIGIFFCVFAAKAITSINKLNGLYFKSTQNWITGSKWILKSWELVHIANIIFSNLFWIVVNHYTGNPWQTYMLGLLSLFFGIFMVSGIFNHFLINQNEIAKSKLKNIDSDSKERMRIWNQCMKASFISYIPVIGTFGLIPYFIAKEVIDDMEENTEHGKQYIKKCQFLFMVLILEIFIPLPYLSWYLSFAWKNEILWMITPHLIWAASFMAINFYLSISKSVYAEMFLSKTKQYPTIEKINLLSKVASGFSLFSIAGLPFVFLFMKKFKKHQKETESERSVPEPEALNG